MDEEVTVKTADLDKRTQKWADFCLNRCTPCKKAREKEKGFFYWMVKIEGPICPACRAYKKQYGVPAYEKPPEGA